jgi:N-acetylmuramoyl-L-alanine amidase
MPGAAPSAYADGVPPQDPPVSLKIDGAEIATDVPPVIVNDRTLVPARAVFEALGGTVEWHDNVAPPKVAISYSDIEVLLTIDSAIAFINGREAVLDVPAQIIDSRTLIPVRFVSEALNFSVTWDEPARTVNIYSYKPPAKSVSIDKIDVTASETGTRVTITGSGILPSYTSVAEWDHFYIDFAGAALNTTTSSLEWQREISIVEGVSALQFVAGSPARPGTQGALGAPDTRDAGGASGTSAQGGTDARQGTGDDSDSKSHEASDATDAQRGAADAGAQEGTGSSDAGSTGASEGDGEKPTDGAISGSPDTAAAATGAAVSGPAISSGGISQGPPKPTNAVRIVLSIREKVNPEISFSPGRETIYLDFPSPSVMFSPLIDGKLSVVLDPGHGAETPGKRSPDDSLMEYEFNRDMAQKIRFHLERHGVEVLITVPDDTDVSLADRCKFANESDGDIFVSIHANAFGHGWTATNGWEIYVYRKGSYSEQLAKAIQNATIPASGLVDRGLKSERFYVIRNTNMPAVLIEHGFYSNRTEVELLKSDEFRERLAVMDAKGILNFLGVPWVELLYN